MGLKIADSFHYVFVTLFKNKNGFVRGFWEVLAYFFLWYTRSGIKGRFDVYKFVERANTLEEMAIRVPDIEDQLEKKRQISNLGTETDCIMIYGGTSVKDGPRILVRISRNCNGLSSVWLDVQLEGGVSYELPKHKYYVEPKTGVESFVGGGLRIKCLLPMRKWRISFNGLLRKHVKGAESSLNHVKFSFVWTTSSNPFDMKSNIHPKLWSQYLANQRDWQKELERADKYLEKSLQAGDMAGTIQDFTAESDEQELHLWGARIRSVETCDPNSPRHVREYLAYAKTGAFLYYVETKLQLSNQELKSGFLVFSNSECGSVRQVEKSTDSNGNEILTVMRGPFTLKFTIRNSDDNKVFHNGDLVSSSTKVTFSTMLLDDEDEGHAVILESSRDRDHCNPYVMVKPNVKHIQSDKMPVDKMVLSLRDRRATSSDVAGGKGSSLSQLIMLAKEAPHDLSFKVPQGLVTTTEAYRYLMKDAELTAAVSDLEKVASLNVGRIKEACNRTVGIFEDAELPQAVKIELEKSLELEFGHDYATRKFAVRSSASGEDSEELSAAGQMTTFLGLLGFDEICKAVLKCWASQFSFIAVEYKRQNGQLINSPMAVVVQEMLPAEVAGVMFTCNPVTGNPRDITITGNYGLGESVVSASAEPDTFIVDRDEERLTGQVTTTIGKKNYQVIMTETGGVSDQEISAELSKKACLSENEAKQLANIGIMVEEAYGCPVDIEWGISSNQIYLLQARPVTTFDKETNFEIAHELDNSFRAEEDIYSTCNIGEVMPGSFSYLGSTFTAKAIDLPYTWHFAKRMKGGFGGSPYYSRGATLIQNHSFFNIYDLVLRFYHGKPSVITESQMVSFFGRILEDEQMYKTATKRNQYFKPNSALTQTLYIFYDIFTCKKELEGIRESMWNISIEIPKNKTVDEALETFWQQFLDNCRIICHHGTCSMVSSLYNTVILSNLVEGNKGWGESVYKDFAYILATCGGVESADVPSSLEKLGQAIKESEISQTFRELPTKEALNLLTNSSTKAGKEFREFLINHGHRGYKEFDVYWKPWGTNPEPLVKILQEMVSSAGNKPNKKKEISTNETIKNLSTPLTRKNRLILRLVIPLCRRAVAMRERSKSVMIKWIDTSRKAFSEIADLMVKEGRLPDPELLYFFPILELNYLLKTRSPLLIQKAIRRRNLLPWMDKLIFPEITTGIPKPVNLKAYVHKTGSVVAKGVPVSNGIAEGRARVATTLEEASEIQAGEILIAYSTDIGWSPFFPILAGVATEIGGLISHGAVVAREYGLPCIVGVENATMMFKTGDLVVLNGSKGTLERIE